MNKLIVFIVALIIGVAIGAGYVYNFGTCKTQTKSVTLKLGGANNSNNGISITEQNKKQ